MSASERNPKKVPKATAKMTDLPMAERPREKLLAQGAEALSDAELVAILLRTGIKGCNVRELAERFIKAEASAMSTRKCVG